MSLGNYLAKSNGSYEEIRWDFDHEQLQQLYNRVLELGYKQYFAFVRQHQEEILKYISLSPSQRKQKKWMNRQDILLIRLAALQISAATVRLLGDIQEIELLVDGGSYRQFHSVVANGIAPLLFHPTLTLFPFEGFENPFYSK